MIGKHRNDVAVAAEDVLGKALQRLLGPDLDEDPRARGVEECLEALDKLDRCSHLL